MLRLLIALIVGAPAAAQELEVRNGENLFLYFCAECHGRDGQSTGPMAEMLAIEPPSLTRLSERHNGSFPIEKAASKIDGRSQSAGHHYMPIFGPSLDEDEAVAFKLGSGQPFLMSRNLVELLAYLESIQVVSD